MEESSGLGFVFPSSVTTSRWWNISVHLLENMFVFALVGFQGNLSLLQICFYTGLKQMEDKRPDLQNTYLEMKT